MMKINLHVENNPETGEPCLMLDAETVAELAVTWMAPSPVRATLRLHSDPPPFWVDAEGQVRVAGSGVSLERLLKELTETGHHPVHLGRKLSLDFALVYAAVAYYLRHQAEMDAWMKARQDERQRVADERKGNLPPIGGKLPTAEPAPAPVPRLDAPYAGWMREDSDGTIYVGKSQATLDEIIRDWQDHGVSLTDMIHRYPPLVASDFHVVLNYHERHHATVDAYLAARREAADHGQGRFLPSGTFPALPNGFMFLGSHVKSNLPPIGGKFDPSLACGVVMVAMQWEDEP